MVFDLSRLPQAGKPEAPPRPPRFSLFSAVREGQGTGMSGVTSIPLREHRLRELRWHGEGVYELTVERHDLAFTPGDCVAIFGADGVGSRPYSIASGVEEDHLTFLIRRQPGGEVSAYLPRLRPGDPVRLSPPFGWFRPGETAGLAPFVFVATGTGLSPFRSHYRSRPEHPPAALWLGCRQRCDVPDADVWLARPEARLFLSREDAPGFRRGRVTDALTELPRPAGAHFYLCGLDDMIDAVTCFLESQGVPARQIHRECFFNAHY
jgi:ferredoxin-NADP reductase